LSVAPIYSQADPRYSTSEWYVSKHRGSAVRVEYANTQSNNFQNVDFDNLILPNHMRIDYIRVYQNDEGTVGCDPDDHPTANYIKKFSNAYTNNNLTTWAQAGECGLFMACDGSGLSVRSFRAEEPTSEWMLDVDEKVLDMRCEL
jgi:N-acetylmuramoyl-L-alanine amidase CwlA